MQLSATTLISTLSFSLLAAAQYTATYNPYNLPSETEGDQYGTNQCGGGSRQDSLCQNVYVNSVQDFCLWAPPYSKGKNSTIGDTEAIEVAWCMKSGYGTRLIPDGTITGAHFLQTPDYVQVTGFGDLTRLNIPQGDEGGELDPHGPDGTGNPKGGLVFGNSYGEMMQYHEWTNFMAYDQFCIRACKDGANAPALCNHIYDTMGCAWNIPGNYAVDAFSNCDADATEPMGVYGTSTWNPNLQHIVGAVPPAAHPAPESSDCVAFRTISNEALGAPTVTTTSVLASIDVTGSSSTLSLLSTADMSTLLPIPSQSMSLSSLPSTPTALLVVSPRAILSTSTLATETHTAASSSPTSTSSPSPTSTTPAARPFIPFTATTTSLSPSNANAARSRQRPSAAIGGGVMVPGLIAAGAILGGLLV